MSGDLSEELRATDVLAETDEEPEIPSDVPTLRAMTLFDKRPGLEPGEKQEALECVNSVFGLIVGDAWDIEDTQLEVDGQRVDELYVANRLKEINIRIGELRGEEMSQQRDKAISDPVDHSAAIASAEAEEEEMKQLKERVLKRGMAERLRSEENQELRDMAYDIVISIQESRKKESRGGNEPPLYTKDAIITLVYEIVYGDYLFRNKTRKDPERTSYFRSHCKAAASKLIENNFTDLKRVLSAIKHDDFEDLALHRKGCSPEKNAEYDPKSDWLFCDELYAYKFSNEPYGDRHGRERTPRQILKEVKKDVKSNVQEALTNKRRKPDNPALHREHDEAVLVDLYRSFFSHPYALLIKLAEQVQNAQTIEHLGRERAHEKLSLPILRHYAVMAKILMLDDIYRDLVGGGVDHYHPKMRNWFNNIQRERLVKFLGLNGSRKPSLPQRLFSVAGGAGAGIDGHVHDLIASFDESGIELAEAQAGIRSRVMEVFEPFSENIEAIQIIPKPLEKYIDVHRLHETDYTPEIPEGDPLFEVVILTKDEADLDRVVGDVVAATGVRGGVHIDSRPTPGDQPNKGVKMKLTDNSFFGTITVRVNTSTNESRAKRGRLVAGGKRPIPGHIRKRLQRAFREASQLGMAVPPPAVVLDLIEEIALRDNITVTADIHPRTSHILVEGSTPLDLIGCLPKVGARALLYADHAIRKRIQPVTGKEIDEPMDLEEPLEDGDACRIVMGDQVTFGLGRFCFCAGDGLIKVYRKHVNAQVAAMPVEMLDAQVAEILSIDMKAVRDMSERNKRKLVRERLYRSNAIRYLEELNEIFNLHESPQILLVLCMHMLNPGYLSSTSREDKVEELYQLVETIGDESAPRALAALRRRGRLLLHELRQMILLNLVEIGNGNFDPLKALAPCLDRRSPIEFSICLRDVPLVTSRFSKLIGDCGLNIHYTSDPMIRDGITTYNVMLDPPPPDVSSYDVLRLIFRLSHCDFVDDINLNPELFRFSEEMTIKFVTEAKLALLTAEEFKDSTPPEV